MQENVPLKRAKLDVLKVENLSANQNVLCELTEGLKLRDKKIIQMEKKINQMSMKINILSREKVVWRNKFNGLNKEMTKLMLGLQKYFEKDQIEMIKGKIKVRWSNKTLRKAIRIKIAGGYKMLNILRNKIVPLPAPSTVQEHLSELKFEPGILHFNLNVLKQKCANLKPEQKCFIIGFDEKSLIPGVQEDTSTHKRVGTATVEPTAKHLLKNPKKIATHGLIFLAGGLYPRIKEVVDYEFTTNASDPNSMKKKLFEIICATEREGNVFVSGICFDMSPDNTALLSLLGINFTERSTKFFIKHPADPSRRLYIFPDLVHIIKNITCNLRKHPLKISGKMSENLASNYALFDDVLQVYNAQKESSIKIAPKLTHTVMFPSHFDTMREDVAYNLISNDVSRGIDLLNPNKKNATSFVIKQLNKLQLIFNSNQGWEKSKIENFNADIAFLKYMSHDFLPNLKFELARGSVRCIKGGIIAIKSMVELSITLMDSQNNYVYAKHMLNNAVENKFSQIVHRTKKPDALQFSQSLKAVCVSQFDCPVKGSYTHEETDDSNSYDYLAMIKDYARKEPEEINIFKVSLPDNACDRDLYNNKVQRFAFQREVSTIISQNQPIIAECNECWQLISLVQKDNGNWALSSIANSLFSLLESCFRLVEAAMVITDAGFQDSFIENAFTIKYFDHCLSNQEMLIKAYYRYRVKVANASREKQRSNYFGSKSLAADIPLKSK